MTLQKEDKTAPKTEPKAAPKPAPKPAPRASVKPAASTTQVATATATQTASTATSTPAASAAPTRINAAEKPKPSIRQSSVGGAGGSKQKFMAELDELKVLTSEEIAKRTSLEELINNLSKEITQLKSSGVSNNTSSSGSGIAISGELSSTVAIMKQEIQSLCDSNNKLSVEINDVTTSIEQMKGQLDSLKKEEIGLKRDLKIVQFKCDKLSTVDSPKSSRRTPPSRPA